MSVIVSGGSGEIDTSALVNKSGDTMTGALSTYAMQYTTIPAGETVTIPTGTQMLVAGGITVDGTLVQDGRLVVIPDDALSAANDLSDVSNVVTARANLGLGTMATASAADYYAKTSYSASPTAAGEPLKANSSGGIDFLGTVDAGKFTINGANSLQQSVTGELLVGVSGGGAGYVGTEVTAVGYLAAYTNTAPGLVAFGYYAGRGNSGVTSAFFGYYAGTGNAGGSCVGMGYFANYNNTGTSSLAIGTSTGVSNPYNNVIQIGTFAKATKANQAVLGADNASGQGYINALSIMSGTTGGAFEGYGRSSTTGQVLMGRIAWAWGVSTHASRTTVLSLYASDYGGERTGLQIGANGTGPTVGFYGVTPVARQLLATGTGATVDNVISALQALGLLRQS